MIDDIFFDRNKVDAPDDGQNSAILKFRHSRQRDMGVSTLGARAIQVLRYSRPASGRGAASAPLFWGDSIR